MSKEKYNQKLAEDAAKRFKMLCEYTFNITEDDDEMNPDMNGEGMNQNENPNQVATDGQDMQQGGDMNQQGMGSDEMGGMQGDPTGDDMQNMPMDNNQMNPDMNGGGAPGFDPSMDFDEMNPDMNGEEMQSDDEVIDVDELTTSQEETEEKVDDIQVSMDKGFDKLLGVVAKLNKMIDASTENMEQLKREIEKRNPTPLEKLNMRAANDSYPFNVSPESYWKDKEATSNYRIGGEDEPDAEQYVITQGDIDKISDFDRISKELSSFEENQSLKNIFGLR